MKIQGTPLALWSAAGALVLPFLLGLGRLGAPGDPSPRVAAAVATVGEGRALGSMADSLAQLARARAPFRADGRPAPVAYDPTRAASPMPSYGAPKPGLVLTGLVGGPASLALLEGIPGREGPVLLAVGDTIAGLKIRRIKEGHVTVTGMDTTWVLAVRRMP
jgi:hypothetical protein